MLSSVLLYCGIPYHAIIQHILSDEPHCIIEYTLLHRTASYYVWLGPSMVHGALGLEFTAVSDEASQVDLPKP